MGEEIGQNSNQIISPIISIERKDSAWANLPLWLKGALFGAVIGLLIFILFYFDSCKLLQGLDSGNYNKGSLCKVYSFSTTIINSQFAQLIGLLFSGMSTKTTIYLFLATTAFKLIAFYSLIGMLTGWLIGYLLKIVKPAYSNKYSFYGFLLVLIISLFPPQFRTGGSIIGYSYFLLILPCIFSIIGLVFAIKNNNSGKYFSILTAVISFVFIIVGITFFFNLLNINNLLFGVSSLESCEETAQKMYDQTLASSGEEWYAEEEKQYNLDDCYEQNAVKLKNITICDNIEENLSRYSCWAFVAFEKKDISICDSLPPTEELVYVKDSCYASFVRGNISKDISICDKASLKVNKVNCYIDFVKSNPGTSVAICDNVFEKEDCVVWVTKTIP